MERTREFTREDIQLVEGEPVVLDSGLTYTFAGIESEGLNMARKLWPDWRNLYLRVTGAADVRVAIGPCVNLPKTKELGQVIYREDLYPNHKPQAAGYWRAEING